MNEHRIAAGIVTYNPDIVRLQENVLAIKPQVELVYIFDNGSLNGTELQSLICDKVILIKNDENKGIAYALNRLFERAREDEFEWLLTLDQDSICANSFIERVRDKMDYADSITTWRRDNNYHTTEMTEDNKIKEVDRCITSGNLVRINAWEQINGFNERLFIDMVDVDFCFRLREKGKKIVRIGFYGLEHQMGDGTQFKLLGKNIYIGNYSAFRKYYIARNMVYVIKKYNLHHHYYSYKRLMLLFLHALFMEKEKRKRCRALIKGVRDGFKQYEYIDSYWNKNCG